jgi:hypothetical protein
MSTTTTEEDDKQRKDKLSTFEEMKKRFGLTLQFTLLSTERASC